jgi:hypothetical protein
MKYDYKKYFISTMAKGETNPLSKWFDSDFQFHQLYPLEIQLLSNKHWTPLNIIQKAVQFLAPEDGVKILDIGSGVGKFCLAGAYYNPGASFYGIEQRGNLSDYAEKAKNVLGLRNVNFMHGNFTQLDLKLYDHFYFYNSFFENLEGSDKIDSSLLYSESLYNYYSQYLRKELEKMPSGTRMVTRCSWDDEIPSGFHLAECQTHNFLKFWIKE